MTDEERPANGRTTSAEALAQALRIVELADARGLQVRLMGGLAFRAVAPGWPRHERPDPDIDVATRGKDRKVLSEILVGEGFTPDKQQNALFGHKQMYFVDIDRRLPLDVLVDRFEMCHTFEFKDRLGAASPTLPLAELLLTKLQIVKVNRKDVLDALVLLATHPLADGDGSAATDSAGSSIDQRRITDLTSGDWGWWRTITGNLDTLLGFLHADLKPGELDTGHELRFDAADQTRALRAAIDAASKSARWKMRARVGDRMAWYVEPEEMTHNLG